MPTVKPEDIRQALDWAYNNRLDRKKRLEEDPKREYGMLPLEAYALAFQDAMDDAVDCCEQTGALLEAMLRSKLLVNPFTPAQRDLIHTRIHYCRMVIANAKGITVDQVILPQLGGQSS